MTLKLVRMNKLCFMFVMLYFGYYKRLTKCIANEDPSFQTYLPSSTAYQEIIDRHKAASIFTLQVWSLKIDSCTTTEQKYSMVYGSFA